MATPFVVAHRAGNDLGILRRAELGSDGAWHDGLLMDLLIEELT